MDGGAWKAAVHGVTEGQTKAKVGRRYIAFVGAPMAAVAQGRESVPRASRNRGSGVSGEATFLPFALLVLVKIGRAHV